MLERPRVGVGVIVSRGEKILMLKRRNPHGKGTWTSPGGHLEFGESPEECAIREVQEETGLVITDIRSKAITNDLFEETGKHYITIWLEAKCLSGEPVINSPSEISAVGWYAWDELPEPFFLTFQNLTDGTNCYGDCGMDTGLKKGTN